MKVFSVVLLLLSLFLLLPSSLCAKTPDALKAIIQSFQTEKDLENKLDLAYRGLDIYDSVENKDKTIDRADRNSLSEMKRLLLIDLMRKDKFTALPSTIGTGGTWLLDQKIKNDYDESQTDEIARLKNQGYYMEGLSDLDFVIMGPEAKAFTQALYEILAKGRGNANLLPDELDMLEINFITDDQIRDIAPGGDRRKFWKQMLDLSRSEPHPEKYITKGGKAIYCEDHLYLRGAALKPGDQPQAMPFKTWTDSSGFDIGPFTPQYLYGGCCDIDYFMRHAQEKDQTPVKSVLQLVKYLERQAWMLEQAEENSGKMAEGLSFQSKHIEGLKKTASELRGLCGQAMDQAVWRSSEAAQKFMKEALEKSGEVCVGANFLAVRLGYDLLWRLDDGDLTPQQAVVLDEIAYDLRTVHEKRYPRGRPGWYEGHEKTVVQETLDFLKAYDERGGKIFKLLVESGTLPPKEDALETIEIGPISPPPVLVAGVKEVAVTPVQPKAGETVTFSVKCRLDGLIKNKPDWDDPWMDPAQKKAMEQVALWSWFAAQYRMQISHLLKIDAENRTKGKGRIYICPYEIEDIIKNELSVCEDEVAENSKKLGMKMPNGMTGRFMPNLAGSSGVDAVKDYLSALSDTYDQSKFVMEWANGYAGQILELLQPLLKNCPPDARRGITELETMQKKATELLKSIEKAKGEIETYKGHLDYLDQVLSGDFSGTKDKLGELADYLDGLADETELNIWDSTALCNRLNQYVSVFPRHMSPRDWPKEMHPLYSQVMQRLPAWHKDRDDLMFSKIPKLQEELTWLKKGAWAAKSAKHSLEVVGLVVDMVNKSNEVTDKLASTDLASETEQAVWGLAMTGEVIKKAANFIPLTVLKDTVKDYAGLLADAATWSSAFDTMMRNRAQGQGYDVKSVLIPEAYEALITQNEARWEAGQFYRYEGPLASYNDLIIFAHPVPDAKERGVKKTGRSSLTGDPMWLIWDKSRKDGFLRLTPELFRQASNYAAWYRRVEGKAISCLELFDLLIEQKSVGGILSFYKVITPTSLKDKAEKVLSIEAFVTYLGLVAGKSEFKPDEARRYFGMLDQAARLLAAEGFIMTDYDVKELVCEAKPDPPEQGTWEKVAEAIPFTATLPKSIRDTSAMWDSLNEGEKARMNQAVEKLIEKKKKLRAEAREQFWTDRTRGVAAGLALEDVKIVIEHSLDGKDVSASSSSLEAPNGEEFTLQWTATLPEQAEDTAAYVCSISIAGFDKSGSALSREIKIAPQVEKPPEEKVGQTPGVQGTDYGKPALPPCPPEVACPIPMGAKHEWSGDREYYTLNGKKVGVEKYWNKSHTVVLNENGYTEDQENPRYSRHYYENGQLASSIWFKGKDRHGRELAFHKNGKKRAEAIWIDDNQVAYWRWSENGNPESEGIQYDKRSWTKCYHPNGKPYSEENRVLVENHFVKHGKQTYWHENGQKMSEDYYKHDKMNGKSVMWNDQGIKTRDKEYKEDQLHGRSTAWSEKGVIQFVCDYKDGKEHGVQQRYDMEGKLRYEENYREGQKHGKDTTYYPSGKVQYESYYKDGKLEGPYFFYSEDGQPIVEGNYADGKKQGEFRRFNKSGKIINVEIYDKDMLIETRAF